MIVARCGRLISLRITRDFGGINGFTSNAAIAGGVDRMAGLAAFTYQTTKCPGAGDRGHSRSVGCALSERVRFR